MKHDLIFAGLDVFASAAKLCFGLRSVVFVIPKIAHKDVVRLDCILIPLYNICSGQFLIERLYLLVYAIRRHTVAATKTDLHASTKLADSFTTGIACDTNGVAFAVMYNAVIGTVL